MGETYHIRDVGPVTDLEVTLESGVNILTGPNGAGKTRTIAAITRASGDNSQSLEVRDGAERGSVQGPGVLLSVGKRIRCTGEPVVELADHGALARLIEPAIKGDAARARGRVEALLEIVDLRVGRDEVLQLAGGDSMVAAAAEGALRSRGGAAPILDVVANVRKMSQALAREAETKRDEAKGAADVAQRQLVAIEAAAEGAVAEPVDAVRERLSGAVRRVERVREAATAKATLIERQEQIRGSIGERPDMVAANGAVLELEALEADLDKRLEALRVELSAARFRLAARLQAAEVWDRQQAILDQPVTGPEAADVLHAEEQEKELQELLAAALDAERAAKVRAEAEKAKRELGAREDEAEHFRRIAAGVSVATREILRARGLPGLEIDEDQLAYAGAETAGEVVPFDRLSLGQRTRIALRLAAEACRGKTLPLDPGYWASLQPAARGELAAAAAEAGLYVVTEEPSDVEGITVAHLPVIEVEVA